MWHLFEHFSDLADQEAVRRFSRQEIELGELSLAQGDFKSCAEHFGLAIALNEQPHMWLEVMEERLPPEVIIGKACFRRETNKAVNKIELTATYVRVIQVQK